MKKLLIGSFWASVFCVSIFAKTPKLRFIGDFSLPKNLAVNGMVAGGFSALSYDSESKLLWALSDVWEGHPRMFKFHLQLAANRVALSPVDVFPFRDATAEKNLLPKQKYDLEGLVRLPGGHSLVTTEGSYIEGGQPLQMLSPPLVLRFDQEGRLVGRLPVVKKAGIENCYPGLTFEGLTFDYEKNELYVAMENPLKSDGPKIGFHTSGLARIIKYALPEGATSISKMRPASEFAYPVNKVQVKEGTDTTGKNGTNGIVELLFVSDAELWILERSFDTASYSNQVRLYSTTLDETLDVSNIESLKGEPNPPRLKKTLLLDLNDIIGQLSSSKKLDNIEGMAFGPVLPNGNKTLILVSDDNFNPKHQQSVFYFFEIQD